MYVINYISSSRWVLNLFIFWYHKKHNKKKPRPTRWWYGNLNETVPHGLRFLSTWFHDGIWWRLGGVILLKEVCYKGWPLRFQSLMLLPVCSSCFLFVVQDVSSRLLFQEACLSFVVTNSNPPDQPAQINSFISCLNHGILLQQ